MKPFVFSARVIIWQLIAVTSITSASAVVFTTDTSIGALDTSYDGQDVVVSNCIVTIDGIHAFNSVRLATGGTLTHTASSNDLSLIITNDLQVEPGGAINLTGRGFEAGTGTGAGAATGSILTGAGAGHAGCGGISSSNAIGGTCYGLMDQPTTLGSGGGQGVGGVGGNGGGAIKLTVGGATILDGLVSANGANATNSRAGGGSGGSIWITAQTVSGAGTITANGGNGEPIHGGGGGGGRIAIHSDTNNFTGTLAAFGGLGWKAGGAGTVFTKSATDNGLLTLDNNSRSGTNSIINSSSSTPSLIVRNGAIGRTSSATTLENLAVLSNSTLVVAGNLTITNNALVEPSGSIHTDGLGFNGANGFGTFVASGIYYGGGGANAGYGGNGGTSNARGGNAPPTFTGSTSSPTTQGGAGGGSGSSFSPFGGIGGGALRITVNGSLTNNGRISSDGKIGSGLCAGGGAGGSVWMTLGNYYGIGTVSANGGPGILPGGGGGGGGRISITLSSNFSTGPISAYGGSGTNYGGAGTVYIKTNSQNLGTLIIDNGGNMATNTIYENNGVGHLVISGGANAILSGSSIASVLIKSNGVLTATQSTGQRTLSTLNMTIDTGGAFTLDGRGNGADAGTGRGNITSTPRGGASHGGFGALNFNNSNFGIAYGSVIAPVSAGSGGASGSGSSVSPLGGAGGGALRLQFNNQNAILTVNGRLSVNGLNGELNSGGGSGGSLHITGVTLAGNGIISANGGAGNGTAGGGGGGRIAITYNTNLFTGQITANGGAGAVAGGAGTIYTKHNSETYGSVLINNGSLSGTNTPLSSSFGLPTSPFNLTISGGAAVFALTPLPQLSNLVINAASTLTMYPEFSVSLNVLRDVTIAAGGAINVDGKGFGRGSGTSPGATLASKGAGGGYGGAGGNSQSGALGGTNYGSALKPVDRGSGGGAGANAYSVGCEGGGAVQMIVGGTLSMNGSVSANGNPGLQDDSGGGSGGSIWISAGALTGAGSFSATGGDGDLFGGGGGGGGRIAIYSPTNTFAGNINVNGGIGANSGGGGSLYISTNIATYAISGTVTNLLGVPQQGATLQPTGFASTTTDLNGNYTLNLPIGWVGAVTPAVAGNVVVPSSRSYTGLYSDVTNANYLAVPSVTPVLQASLSETNLVFNWSGVPGVNYQAYWSTNLSTWAPWGGPFTGSNGIMQLLIPANDLPQKFVRMQVDY